MRTIQVREIPDDAYDVMVRRARAEGKSLQSYMNEQIVALARHPTKSEATAAIERALARFGPATTSPAAIRADIEADRH